MVSQVASDFFSGQSVVRVGKSRAMPIARRLTAYEKRVVAARGEWRCSTCTDLLQATYEVDHTIPLHKGGDDHIDNCTALCKECHAQKTMHEEIERLRILQAVRGGAQRRPPMMCMRCSHIVSPFFVHECST